MTGYESCWQFRRRRLFSIDRVQLRRANPAHMLREEPR